MNLSAKKNFIKSALSLEEVESGKIVQKTGWLKAVWGKWPGDEPIEELLAMLEGDREMRKSAVQKERRQRRGHRKKMTNQGMIGTRRGHPTGVKK